LTQGVEDQATEQQQDTIDAVVGRGELLHAEVGLIFNGLRQKWATKCRRWVKLGQPLV
jgi:hypothetical protein